MTPERAAEILEAYGADPVRWPADERAAAAMLIAGSPGLRERQARAMALDAALSRWACAPLPTADPQPSIARALASLPPRAPPHTRPHRWLAPVAGGAIAAALGAALVLRPAPVAPPAPAPPTVVPAPAPELARTDAELFQMIFTPTPEEELLL